MPPRVRIPAEKQNWFVLAVQRHCAAGGWTLKTLSEEIDKSEQYLNTMLVRSRKGNLPVDTARRILREIAAVNDGGEV